MTFEPPDVNRGNYRFEPVTDKVIRYGLGAVKGTGQQAIEAIVRGARGGRAVHEPVRLLRAGRPPAHQQAHGRGADQGRRLRLAAARTAPALLASVDRAFDFAARQRSQRQPGRPVRRRASTARASTQEPELVDATPWGVKERLTFEKTAIGFYLSGHLFDEVAHEVRRFAKREIDELIDSREPQLLAGIVSDLRVINGQRGKLAMFKLDDKTDIDRGHRRRGGAQRQPQPAQGRRTGDRQRPAAARPRRLRARFSVQQVWDLATARCRFGKFLRVAVNGKAPDIARLVRDFPPRVEHGEQGELLRGLPVRLSLAPRRRAGRAAAGRAGEVLPDRRRAGQLDGAGRRRPGGHRL